MDKTKDLPIYPVWIMTATGKAVNPLKIKTEDIDIRDIAHALTNICRFNGHCKRFYSVAEHSLYMSVYVSPEAALYALLHDAPEIYISDIPKPLKGSLLGFREIELRIWNVIADKFNLNPKHAAEVKAADLRMLCTEKKYLMANTRDFECCENIEPYHISDGFLNTSPVIIKRLFMRQYLRLTQDSPPVV